MRLPAFFVYRRDATGTRSANCILTLHHRREQDVGSPARTVVIDPKEPDTPAGICHPLRAHSPNRSTGGPLSTRRSGDRLHLSDISGGSVRSQERSRGKRAGRSEKQGAFVGKCGESHGKRGAFSRLCGIRSAHKPTPCDDRAGKKKRSALFLQRKRADRSLSGHCARWRQILVSNEVTTAQRLGQASRFVSPHCILLGANGRQRGNADRTRRADGIRRPQRTTFSTAPSSRSGSMSRATTVPVASMSRQPGT